MIVAVRAALFAKSQAKKAGLQKLFVGFHGANEASLAHPDVMRDVHSIENDIDDDELKCVAYLSILIDTFESYYGEKYEGKFRKMADELTNSKNTVFLNRILSVDRNQRRWKIIRDRYYGNGDREFKRAIDRIIKYENEVGAKGSGA